MGKRKENEIISALAELLSQIGEIEITASGFIMVTGINITSKEAAKILKRMADEVFRDKYFNHNIYRISFNSLMELVKDESGGISESE